MVFASPVYAQHFDLTEMPDGYTYTGSRDGLQIVVTHMGSEDGLFLFSYVTNDGATPFQTITVGTNRNNQMVEYSIGLESWTLTPHNCRPQKGRCEYSRTLRDDTMPFISETYVTGGIWFNRLLTKGNQGWYAFERSCTTFDEYGFSIDSYTEYSNGDIEWSTRETTQGIPDSRANFEALEAICESRDALIS